MLVFKALSGLVAFSALGRSQTTTQDDFRSKCASFRPNIPNARFEFAELIQSGTAANLPYADKTCGGPQQSNPVSQDICRVTMYLQTSAQSGVQFEAWLPKTWNGRFLATGNGGIGGCKSMTIHLRHASNQSQVLTMLVSFIRLKMASQQWVQTTVTMELRVCHSLTTLTL
jgi:hypothetical protein